MAGRRRPLIILDQSPKLKTLEEKLEAAEKTFKEKRMFLEKQIEEAHRKTVLAAWEEVSDFLVQEGILEKYDKTEDELILKDGVIFHCKQNGNDTNRLPHPFKILFGLDD